MFSGQRLRELREERGLSQAMVAQQLGISRSSYFNWENDKTQPNQKNREKLSRLLAIEPEELEAQAPLVAIYLQLTSQHQQQVLTYSQELLNRQISQANSWQPQWYAYKVYEKLSAGTGYAYLGDGNYETVFWKEELDHDFSSWIYGDSMEPLYLNGEVALIKQTGFDYDGAIYAIDWDGQTYIKKVYREAEGLRLVSINRKYADKFAPYSENPRIIGKIVGHFNPIYQE